MASAAGASGAAAAAFSAADFDPQQPAAFYLCGRLTEMEALADATAVVEGVRLPLHSQVGGGAARVNAPV